MKDIEWRFRVWVPGTNASVSEAIKLHPCEVIDVSSIESPQEYPTLIGNQEILASLEELVQSWCKQIEQVRAPLEH